MFPDHIAERLANHRPTLTLVRGLPGSGKSTLAKQIADASGAVHCESDMYFVTMEGSYHFDRSKLANAHAWCLNYTEQCLERRRSVVVSNTFVEAAELNPYRTLAILHNARLQIITVEAEFGSVHDVPPDVMADMKARWTPTL